MASQNIYCLDCMKKHPMNRLRDGEHEIQGDEPGARSRVERGILVLDCLCDLCNADLPAGTRAAAVTFFWEGQTPPAWEHEYMGKHSEPPRGH